MSLIKISKKNKIYFNTLIKFILPLIIHDLVVNLFSYVDLLMVGQLGDTAVAAVGICNQIYTIFILLVFGIYSGVSIFIAQYNGEENILNIKKMLGISIVFSFFISLLFGLLAIIIPDKILSIYTNDPAVIETGSVYLRLIGFSLIFLSIYFSYSMALKSIGNTRIPMIIGVISILLNTGLNFILIFGFYSIPALGVAGAGIATLISRIVGFILLIAVIYIKKYVIAAHIKEIFSFLIKLVKQFLKVAFPLFFHFLFWSLGANLYFIIYAKIGTGAIAAFNIYKSIENIIFVFFIVMANAGSVMIGNQIGANKKDDAYSYSKKFISITIICSVFLGIIIFLLKKPVLSIFNISDVARNFSIEILSIFSFFLVIKAMNILIINGILRSGGDTKFTFFIDVLGIWLIGVPVVLLSAFIFKFPVHLIYLLSNVEEIIKLLINIIRYFSKQWLKKVISTQ